MSTWSTLVNERPSSQFIQQLTGNRNGMVTDAPTFTWGRKSWPRTRMGWDRRKAEIQDDQKSGSCTIKVVLRFIKTQCLLRNPKAA